MLDKLVFGMLGKNGVERFVRQELERLQQGGFLEKEELERLSAECLSALEGRLDKASKVIGPALGGLAAQVREALDIPSRAEVIALTEALARAERARTEGKAGPAPQADVVGR